MRGRRFILSCFGAPVATSVLVLAGSGAALAQVTTPSLICRLPIPPQFEPARDRSEVPPATGARRRLHLVVPSST